eukprot:gene41368-42241_t
MDEELRLIRGALDVGREEVLRQAGDSLRHVGVRIRRSADCGYSVDQDDYAAALEGLDVSDPTAADDAPYADADAFRARVGQLLWLNQTRPCLAFTVARLASYVRAPTYGAARTADAAVAEARASSFALSFCKLGGELQLLVFADASFGRNADGTSQGGYAAVLVPRVPDGAVGDVVSSTAVLLEWSSARIRRVCRSTLGAELLVAGGATDASNWLRNMCLEVGLLQASASSSMPPDYIVSDAKSVTTALDTTRIPRERSLMPDLYRLRQMTAAGEVQLLFVNSGDMVADALTKPAKDSRTSCEALARLATANEVNVPLMLNSSR